MLGKLPELFDRAFLIAHLVPALLFLAAFGSLFGLSLDLGLLETADTAKTVAAPGSTGTVSPATSAADKLAEAGIALAVAWLLALALAALNRLLVRVLEGYTPPLKWIRPLKRLQQQRLRYVKNSKKQFDSMLKSHENGTEVLPEEGEAIAEGCQSKMTIQGLMRKRTEIMLRISRSFPHEENLVLPTSLGNVIRAFEVYPFIVYGLDGIPGWLRIIGLMPKEMRIVVDDAKAIFDLAVNLVWLGLVLGIIAGTQAWHEPGWWPAIFAAGGFIVAVTAYFGAVAAAVQWGELVKASFDLLIPKLAANLGYRFSKSADPRADEAERRNFWSALSQSMVYRVPFIPPSGVVPIVPPQDGGDRNNES